NCPSGESSGLDPSARRHPAPGVVVRAAQIARSAPFGSLVGSAIQPSRFGADPRTKTTTAPSSEILTWEMSVPSSLRNDVTRTGVKLGAAAVYTLRRPWS